MRRSLLLTTVLVALTAACGGDDGGGSTTTTAGASPTSVTAATAAPGATTSTPATAVDALVFFGRDGKVAAAGRSVQPPAVARGALEALLAGPDELEADLGMTSAVAENTRLLSLDVADGVATVDLSGEFVNDPDGDHALGVAQVVFTLTRFPTIDRVTILIEGVPTPSVGFDAVPVAEVDRADFEEQTPFVLVESPTPGATVGAPVAVTGIANTFEATVVFEVTDAEGQVLDAGSTTATAGSGTWGEFTFTIHPGPGAATLTVFQESAEDGSRVDEYVVPLVVT